MGATPRALDSWFSLAYWDSFSANGSIFNLQHSQKGLAWSVSHWISVALEISRLPGEELFAGRRKCNKRTVNLWPGIRPRVS
jgi:hypothetical protein